MGSITFGGCEEEEQASLVAVAIVDTLPLLSVKLLITSVIFSGDFEAYRMSLDFITSLIRGGDDLSSGFSKNLGPCFHSLLLT